MRRFSVAAALFTTLAISRSASAQSFDSHLFRPAIDSKGFFGVNGAEVMPHGGFSTGLVIDYGRNAPVFRDAFAGTFHLDYGLFDRAIIGVSLPAILLYGPNQDVEAIQGATLQGKVKLSKNFAIAAQLGVPLSEVGADHSVWFWPRAVFEKRFGVEEKLRFGLEAGWRGHSNTSSTRALRDGQFRDGSLVTYGAAVSYRILEPVDLVAETYGTYLLSDAASGTKPSNEALAGFKVFVEKNSFLLLGAGPRYTGGFEAADFRATVGFVFEPKLERAAAEGTPDPLFIPEDPPMKIPDPPKPETPDFDHDLIPDAVDACPTIPGKPRDDPKTNGCPDVWAGPGKVFVLEKIHFETDKATIKPESFPILDEIAKVLEEHSEIDLIEIAGHADERGPEIHNLKLTQARVNSVMTALVQRHVDQARLRAKGYGYYCPLEDGHDEEAWSKNRRVEFMIVKSEGKATNYPLGCDTAASHGIKPEPIP